MHLVWSKHFLIGPLDFVLALGPHNENVHTDRHLFYNILLLGADDLKTKYFLLKFYIIFFIMTIFSLYIPYIVIG